MFLEPFLFAEKVKIFTKGEIHGISRSFLGIFYCMRGHSLVGLTEHDNRAADIMAHNVCVCMCVFIPFILDVWFVDVPAGVTQEEGHT